MFNLLDVHSILICLDQFHSLDLTLILKFHNIILAPLLVASFTRQKQSSSYCSNCSGLGVAFVHMSNVYYCFFLSVCYSLPLHMMIMSACVWTSTLMR
jgi:hypothetical protein